MQKVSIGDACSHHLRCLCLSSRARKFRTISAAAGKAFALTDKQLDAAVDFLDPNGDGNVSQNPPA